MRGTIYLSDPDQILNQSSNLTAQSRYLSAQDEDSGATPDQRGRQDGAENEGHAYLLWKSGRLAGHKVPIDRDYFIVGRDKDRSHLLIKLSCVSRQHVAFKTDERGVVTLIDPNSTNGIFVNGEQVKQQKLKNGDEIDIGCEGFVAFTYYARTVAKQSSAPANSSEEMDLTIAQCQSNASADRATTRIDLMECSTVLLAAEMKQCPDCRSHLRPPVRYCTNCGFNLQASWPSN